MGAPASADASTRERLLEVALEAFSELGFDGASTREIAARAGVNQGLIPYYFGTKDALWREAVDHAFAGLREALGELSPEKLGDRATLEALIRRFVRFSSRHPEFSRLIHEEGKRDGPRMHWLVDRHVRPLSQAIGAFYERAGALGRLGARIDPIHLHYIVVGAATIIFHQGPECRRLTGRDPRDEAFADAHADALIALLLGDPED